MLDYLGFFLLCNIVHDVSRDQFPFALILAHICINNSNRPKASFKVNTWDQSLRTKSKTFGWDSP